MRSPQPSHSDWTRTDVGEQRGRTAVVTGANTGIGFEVAKTLADRGATVVLACRDVAKGDDAAARIVASTGATDVDVIPLDLASLDSVRAAAERIRTDHPRLDLLVNNAGVMWAPQARTADGFERHLGINHLGHFALTGLLLDRLQAAPGARVVTVSSSGHKHGAVDLHDLHFDRRRYRPMAAYAQSKLANLLFTHELQRRLAETGSTTTAVAAHPGGCRTELMRNAPPHIRIASGRRFRMLFTWLIHDPPMGALPVLRAAVDPTVHGGDYYGPDGWGEWTGYPARTEPRAAARDEEVQQRLWEESERLTGVTYALDIDSASWPR